MKKLSYIILLINVEKYILVDFRESSMKMYSKPYGDERHSMNEDDYKIAKIKLTSQNQETLNEARLTYINTLSYNGCWEFEFKMDCIDEKYVVLISFKWNGKIGAIDACSKLKFNDVETEWIFN